MKKGKSQNRSLYEAICKKIEIAQQNLRLHYQSADQSLGMVIHHSVETFYDLKTIFFDLLVDEHSSKKILEIENELMDLTKSA